MPLIGKPQSMLLEIYEHYNWTGENQCQEPHPEEALHTRTGTRTRTHTEQVASATIRTQAWNAILLGRILHKFSGNMSNSSKNDII